MILELGEGPRSSAGMTLSRRRRAGGDLAIDVHHADDLAQGAEPKPFRIEEEEEYNSPITKGPPKNRL